ncbi:MAG TPA: hypothetical protein VNT30_13965 [Stellaceae bacterium]|nr:hypothetical protein [Stellaceae bacterium]
MAIIRMICGLVIVWTLVAIVETAGGQILPRDVGHEQLLSRTALSEAH